MKFVCYDFPELSIGKFIKFERGEFSTEDEKLIASIASFSEQYGILRADVVEAMKDMQVKATPEGPDAGSEGGDDATDAALTAAMDSAVDEAVKARYAELKAMSKEDLTALALQKGIAVSGRMGKDALATAIMEKN